MQWALNGGFGDRKQPFPVTVPVPVIPNQEPQGATHPASLCLHNEAQPPGWEKRTDICAREAKRQRWSEAGFKWEEGSDVGENH